jgi:hypothetical protein
VTGCWGDKFSFFCVETLIGLMRAWINGLSGDSSAKGIFSPSVNGRFVGCGFASLATVCDAAGFGFSSSISFSESTEEFLRERSLSSRSVVISFKDIEPGM